MRHDWRCLRLRLLLEALLRRRTFDDVRKGRKHGRCGSRKLRESRRYRIQISIDLLLILIQVQCRRRVALQVPHRVEFRQRADKGVNERRSGVRGSIAIQAYVTEVIRVADCRRADRKNWLLCNEKEIKKKIFYYFRLTDSSSRETNLRVRELTLNCASLAVMFSRTATIDNNKPFANCQRKQSSLNQLISVSMLSEVIITSYLNWHLALFTTLHHRIDVMKRLTMKYEC